MLIGLATAVKLVPGVFIVYLLVTGRRRAAAVAAVTCAAATALAWAIAPGDSVGYWTSAVFNPSRLGPNGPAANQSLRGAILRLWSPAAAPAAVWLTVAVLVAIAGFAAARAVQRRGDELAGIAITGLLAALLSPVAWIHHFCWVVVVLGVLIGDGRNPRRLLTAAAAGALFAYAVPFWGKELLIRQAAPVLLARTVEDAFTIAGLVLIVIIFRTRTAGPGAGAGARPDAEPGASQVVAEGKVLAGSRGG
jgi:alpha-1,2-mannosyltransferase